MYIYVLLLKVSPCARGSLYTIVMKRHPASNPSRHLTLHGLSIHLKGTALASCFPALHYTLLPMLSKCWRRPSALTQGQRAGCNTPVSVW